MTMMLKAIYAMNKTPGSAAKTEYTAQDIDAMIERSTKASRVAHSKANCEKQLSTVVKMCLDGHTIDHITKQTGVSIWFVVSTKAKFDLGRAPVVDQKANIKKILMESPAYTHNTASISKMTGYRKDKVTKIIATIPQIERGNVTGLKNRYKYNFDIPVIN